MENLRQPSVAHLVTAGLVIWAGLLVRLVTKGYCARRIFHRMRKEGLVRSVATE